MEKKNKIKYVPDWQLLKDSDSGFDLSQENDGNEADEYNFYRLAGNDHNALEIDKGE